MDITFASRRQTHHNNIGVLSDADLWQGHARLTVRARGPRQQIDAGAVTAPASHNERQIMQDTTTTGVVLDELRRYEAGARGSSDIHEGVYGRRNPSDDENADRYKRYADEIERLAALAENPKCEHGMGLVDLCKFAEGIANS